MNIQMMKMILCGNISQTHWEKKMKAALMTLVVAALCLSTIGTACAASLTVNATGRQSVYIPTPSWDDFSWAYIANEHDQYVKFDLGALANNPNIAIDSAFVTIKPDAYSWNGIWDSVAGLYRAPDLNFVNMYLYDNSIMYSSDALRQSANSVFDATNLVSGWAAGTWTGVTGGVALHYINPPPPDNGNLMYSASDLQGATLTIDYHTVPEPASFVALGMGALGFLLRRRPKKA